MPHPARAGDRRSATGSRDAPATPSEDDVHHAAEILLRLIRRRLDARYRGALPAAVDEDEHAGARRTTHRTPEFDPGEIGAAVVVGRALVGRPGLLRELLAGAPVVEIAVLNQEDVQPVARTFSRAFGARPELGRRLGAASAARFSDHIDRGAHVMPCDGAERLGKGTRYETGIRDSLRRFRPVVCVAVDPRAEYPAFLERLADHKLEAASLEPADIAFVIRKETGAPPPRAIAPDVARRTRFADLALAVHRRRGAAGSLTRLERIVAPQNAIAGPKLSEMAGYGSAGRWGAAAAREIAAYAKGEIDGEACPRGIVLHGPPGVGKTIFGKALAAEAGVPFLSGSLAEWQSREGGYLGTTLKAMRNLFAEARYNAPSILLIDELDGFGNRAKYGQHHEQYWVQICNGLLELLDGVVARSGVVVIGTTNHVERLDPAILRAGRFDKIVRIDLPTVRDIEAILRHHLADDLREAGLATVALAAEGASGADCAALVRRARSRARSEGRPLSVDDLRAELPDRQESGDLETERVVAFHESGHAIVAATYGLKVEELSLFQRASSLGRIQYEALRGAATAARCREIITVALAGRAAETVALGHASAGCADDLSKATEVAGLMVGEWGFGGTLAVCRPAADDPRIELELGRAFDEATRLLSSRREALDALAEALVARRRMTWQDIAEIVGEPGTGSPEKTPVQPRRAPAHAGGRPRASASKAAGSPNR